MLRFRHASFAPVPAIRVPVRLGLVFVAGAAFLSGCGFARFEQREAWRGQAELACMKAGIVQESEFVRITRPIDGSGACGLDIPLKVQAFAIDQNILSSFAQAGAPLRTASGENFRLTVIKPEATLTCPMVAWLDDWLATAVQPASLAWMGQGVKEIRTGGSYACRRRNHQPGAKLSEHAFGNAIDIMSFVFADGSVTTVKGGWRGAPNEQGFLREVLNSACDRFRTVLGPGSDAFHHDHFHLDLARHDARGERRYCRPKVAAPARPAFSPGANPPAMPPSMPPATAFNRVPQANPPGPMPGASALRPQPGTRNAGNAPEAHEQEGEFDPRDFDLTSSVSDLPIRRRAARQQALPAPAHGMITGSTRAPSPRPLVMQQPMMPSGGN